VKLFERRRHQAQLMVIGAILGQGEVTTTQVAERTGLNPARAWLALAALEEAGRVSSRWQDGPYPRRRLYRYAFAKGGIVRATREDT
jgi:DNA-binding IclR family transcriptional regulator